jgi:hypothetical protein
MRIFVFSLIFPSKWRHSAPIWPRPLPSKSFPTHRFWITLPSDTETVVICCTKKTHNTTIQHYSQWSSIYMLSPIHILHNNLHIASRSITAQQYCGIIIKRWTSVNQSKLWPMPRWRYAVILRQLLGHSCIAYSLNTAQKAFTVKQNNCNGVRFMLLLNVI